VRAFLLCFLFAAGACEPARAEPAAGPARVLDDAARDGFRRPDALVALMGVRRGDRVADVGAGDGYLTFRLARASGTRVVATDVDLEALATLVARGVREHALGAVDVRLAQHDAPGLEAHAYDLVLLAQVDHYLADRVGYFVALRAALAPGGRLVLANRTNHEDAALAAAATAGFTLVAPVDHSLPGQYVARFVAKESP
jgi:SAM-dependent methyltransferase